MSFGGGGGPDTVTQTTSSLPEYAEPYYKDLLARTGYESAINYQPYKASRLEYFTPAEQEAMNRITQLGVSGTPSELNMAGSIASLSGLGNPYAQNMLQGVQNAQGYMSQNLGRLNTQNWIDPGVTEAYMSPYMQNVVDIQKREAARQSDIRGAAMGLEAAGQGSLGGYREAIMQAERERNLAQQMNDIQEKGLQSAYDTGLGAFDADREARIKAAMQAQEAASGYANLGIGAYQNLLQGGEQQLQAAGMLGDFAAQRQAMEYERLKNMQAAGEIERQLLQSGLDIGYQDFLRQQAYPKEQLAFYSGILQGTPTSPGGTTAAYGTGPSDMQQLLGAGIAGVGLYNAYGGV